MRAVHKDLMKMIVVELKRELDAGGARRAEDGQQGVAASAAARGHRARAPRRLRAVRRPPPARPNFYRFGRPRVFLPF